MFYYKYMGYRIEILKPGSHVSSSGVKVSLDQVDIANIAANYKPEIFEAPVVVGHPETNSPAYGWIKNLTSDDSGLLFAEIDQVDPEFKAMVNAGRFKNISASLYAPQSPGNPNPGSWYLRHVGFLGAAAPAVKGLKPVSFSTDSSMVFDFNLNIENEHINITKGENDMTKEELEAKEKILVEKEKAIDAKLAEFAESEKSAEVGKLKAKESELESREKALQAKIDEITRAEYASFAEGLIGEGKITPAEKAYVISIMGKLSKESVVNFAEKDMPEVDAFKAFLIARPAKIDLTEHSAADKSGEVGADEYEKLGNRMAGYIKKGR